MQIKQLHINRLPGFRQGLPAYTDLAGQVNIIAGRNGSGKSSTARLIRSLLWWDGARGDEAVAQLLYNGELHTITIESPGYRHQVGEHTTTTSFSDLPPELNQQYLLSLHGLIKDDNTTLAHEINKQLTGGFDLLQAKTLLGYGNGTTTRQNRAYLAYEQARSRRNEIERKQETLKREAETITELKSKMEAAQQAQFQSLLYQKLIEYKEADNQCRDDQRTLDTYSPHLSFFRTDDLDRIRQLKRSIQEINREISSNKEKIEEAQQQLSKLTCFAKTTVAPLFLDRLDGYTQLLMANEKELLQAETTVVQLEEQYNEQIKTMGQSPDAQSPLAMERSTPIDLLSLEHQIQELNQLQQEQLQIETSIRQLRNEIEAIELPDTTQESVDCLNQGIHCLSDWLKEEVKTAPPSPLVGRLLLSVALLATIMQVLYPSVTVAISSLLLLVIGISYTLYYIGRKGKKSDQLTRLEQKYTQYHLELPERWESQPVTATLHTLISRLTSIQQRQEQKSRATVAMQQKAEESLLVNARLKEMMQTINQLFTDHIGFIPTAFQKEPITGNNCFLFIKQWVEWKRLSGETTAWRKRLNHLHTQKQQSLNQINQELEKYHLTPVSDGVTAHSLYKLLTAEEQERNRIENNTRSLQLVLNTNSQTLQAKQEELRNIYQRLQLSDEQDDLIRQLSELHPAYQKVKEKASKAHHIKESRYEALTNDKHYSDSLLQLSLEEAIERQQHYAREASHREQYLSELTSIETKVNERMESDELEKALAEVANSRAALQDSFEQTLQSKTGELLVEQLKRETTLHNNNPLLVEANRLLALFTAGEYALLIEEGEKNSFKALESKTQRRLSLHEISTGTRIQLLLATRLAYIHEQEKGGIHFPILVDELLANSDDIRSETMIQALLEISKERQLFYFTAQADEVIKWERALEAAAVTDRKIYRLGEIDLEKPIPTTEKLEIELFQQVPSYEGTDHTGYGKRLQVTPFDLIEQPLSELHLWYLVEDVKRLHSLLRHRLTTWGQLLTYRNYAGEMEDIPLSQWDDMERKVALLTEFISLYQIGRAKRLTAEELSDSALFNKNYEEALQLLKECDYQSDRFLEAANGIPHFGIKKREKLELFLMQRGKLDNRTPLSREELLQRLAITAQRLAIEESTAQQFLRLF